MKVLFLLLSLVFIWWIVRILLRTPSRKAPQTDIQTMQACHYCGLYVPENEAIHHRGHVYCSQEHAHQDERP